MKKQIIIPGTKINNWIFKGETSQRKSGLVVGLWTCTLCGRDVLTDNSSVIRGRSSKCVECGHIGRRKERNLLSIERKRKLKIMTAEDKAEYKIYRKFEKIKSFEGVRGRAGHLFRGARQRAKELNLPFKLNVKWIEEKIRIGICERTGVSFNLKIPINEEKYNWNAPSLDRIDRTKGYTEENVQMTTWRYNNSKNMMSDEEFILFCQKVCETANLTDPKIVRL